MTPRSFLIVDDHALIRVGLCDTLGPGSEGGGQEERQEKERSRQHAGPGPLSSGRHPPAPG